MPPAKKQPSPGAKVTPSQKQPSPLLAPDDPRAPCRFNLKAFSRLLSLLCMFMLVADVVLEHKYSVTICTTSAGLLSISAIFNYISQRCIYTGGVRGDAPLEGGAPAPRPIHPGRACTHTP